MERTRRLGMRAVCCLVALLLLAGCGGGGGTGGRTPVMGTNGTYPDSGQSLEWPAEIPDEIPVFGARLVETFGDGTRTRLSFREITAHHVVDYATALEAAGYDVEYLAYASNVDEERAGERARRGEYEAIRASKGGYTVFLDFGGGMATLTLDGFPAPPDRW